MPQWPARCQCCCDGLGVCSGAMCTLDAPDAVLHSSGSLLIRSSYGKKTSKFTSQTMVRPFHSLEDQCAAEHRLKAQRCLDASSKAGFLGQLRHLNFVQHRLQAMCPSKSEPCLPEAGFDLAGERLLAGPGTGPSLILDRTSPCASSPSSAGRRRPVAGSGNAIGCRRRRPVHVVTTMPDDDPALISFSEEPEDPRVYLPAHRIGDSLPEVTPRTPQVQQGTPKKPQGLQARSPKPAVSRSAPSLHITANRVPFRTARGDTSTCGGGRSGVSFETVPVVRAQDAEFSPFSEDIPD